jgi:ATP-dependent Clp protease ATP-binding subunit ClpC
MFDRFNEPARKVMGLARQASQKWRHDYIGAEHLLLGLLDADKAGIVVDVLHDLETDAGQVRRDLERRMLRGEDKPGPGQLPFTQGAKRVLERALEEAASMGHSYIGGGHLLVGLIRDEGIAGAALASCGVVPKKARRLVFNLAGRGRSLRDEQAGVLVGGAGADDVIEGIVKPALHDNGIRQVRALNPDSPFCSNEALDRLAMEHGVVVGVADPMTPALAFGLGVCRAKGAFVVVVTPDQQAVPRPFLSIPSVKLERDLPDRTREDLARVLRVATTK